MVNMDNPKPSSHLWKPSQLRLIRKLLKKWGEDHVRSYVRVSVLDGPSDDKLVRHMSKANLKATSAAAPTLGLPHISFIDIGYQRIHVHIPQTSSTCLLGPIELEGAQNRQRRSRTTRVEYCWLHFEEFTMLATATLEATASRTADRLPILELASHVLR